MQHHELRGIASFINLKAEIKQIKYNNNDLMISIKFDKDIWFRSIKTIIIKRN